MVEALPAAEQEALYVLLSARLSEDPQADQPDEPARADEPLLADEPVRQLSFIGIMHAGPDFAERSQEILRSEMGRPEPE